MELREYQKEISLKANSILKKYKIVYLVMAVRTGKTLTSLEICRLYGAKNVLFLTKKKAISSIEDDYRKFGFEFNLTVINDESMHKIEGDFDLVIHDEHHRFGAFPKAGKYTKMFKEKFSNLPMIFLSGTPHPESYSQIFHQFWVSNNSPFTQKSFYKWADIYVKKQQRNFGYGMINDYSECNLELLKPIIKPYIINFTQEQAGFETTIKETILKCRMNDSTYSTANKLMKDKVIVGNKGEIIADTAVKMQQKLHQIYSGTIKFEDGSRFVFDNSKADFIKEKFKGKRIGIFYKFIAEWDLIKETFGESVTNDLDDFNRGIQNIALQVVSGREGISLRNADFLVYYNIDFSATSYWQSRDRLTTMDRKSNEIFWIFGSEFEEKIYKSVNNKKSYTSKAFKKDYGVEFK